MSQHVVSDRQPSRRGRGAKAGRARRQAVPIGLAVAVAVVVPVVVAGGVARAAARTTPSAAGSASCSLTARLTFSPPLTPTGGATKATKVAGTLSGCKVDNAAVSISGGALSGSVAAGFGSRCKWNGHQAATLRLAWHSPPAAPYAPSVIHDGGERLVSSGGKEGFDFPGSASSTVAGSFAGTSALTAGSSDTASALSAACAAKGGLKALTLSGTVSVGSDVLTYGSAGGKAVTPGSDLTAELTSNSTALSCTSGSAGGSVSANPAALGHAAVSITSLTATGCQVSVDDSSYDATVEAEDLPYPLSFGDTPGDPVSLSGVELKLTVSGTPLGTISCTYSASGWSGSFSDSTSSIAFSDQKVTLSAGSPVCPESEEVSPTIGPIVDSSVAGSPDVFVNS